MNRSSQKNLRKERLRLSRKRRKRKKFTSSLGAPFNVVAVTDRIASNWAADFSLGDSVTDGLGGTWTLSGTKQNDPNAKRTGSAPDSTQGSTRIPFASTRTPRMLGSLNVLDLYENDLISVTGSCDENGNNKGSVKRKHITIFHGIALTAIFRHTYTTISTIPNRTMTAPEPDMIGK